MISILQSFMCHFIKSWDKYSTHSPLSWTASVRRWGTNCARLPLYKVLLFAAYKVIYFWDLHPSYLYTFFTYFSNDTHQWHQSVIKLIFLLLKKTVHKLLPIHCFFGFLHRYFYDVSMHEAFSSLAVHCHKIQSERLSRFIPFPVFKFSIIFLVSIISMVTLIFFSNFTAEIALPCDQWLTALIHDFSFCMWVIICFQSL